MTSSSPIRLKIEMDSVHHMHKGDTAFQWPENQRRYWIVAMFCGTLLLYATRSAVPLCMAAMSTDMNWDKEIDVSFVKYGWFFICCGSTLSLVKFLFSFVQLLYSMLQIACVAGVERGRGRGNSGARGRNTFFQLVEINITPFA